MKIAVIGDEFECLKDNAYTDEVSVHINNMLGEYISDYRYGKYSKDIVCVTNLEPAIGFIYAFLAIELRLPLVAIISDINFSTNFDNELDKRLYAEILEYPNIEKIIYGTGYGKTLKNLNRDKYIIRESDIIIFIGESDNIKELMITARIAKKQLINIAPEDLLKTNLV